MKYRLKMKQKAVKVKGQKRRVVEQTPRVYYSDEEIAQMEDYDYGFLLDMMYHNSNEWWHSSTVSTLILLAREKWQNKSELPCGC